MYIYITSQGREAISSVRPAVCMRSYLRGVLAAHAAPAVHGLIKKKQNKTKTIKKVRVPKS